MKTIYFVTEGKTDQIVIQGLIDNWLGAEFIPRYIQPPSSDYIDEDSTLLSQGWKGVVAWCKGQYGSIGRDEAIRGADCLIIHLDADVAYDPDFKAPAFTGPCPPASNACDWIRDHLTDILGGDLPTQVVLCIPSRDIEAWVLSALHPEIADRNEPIECCRESAKLLIHRKYRLVRSKDGRLRKETRKYKDAVEDIKAGWEHCVSGEPPRCPEAKRFEADARRALGL